jgi:hypothetical protein
MRSPKKYLIMVFMLVATLDAAQVCLSASLPEQCSELTLGSTQTAMQPSEDLLPLVQRCDEFGNHAAEAYHRLADVLERENAPQEHVWQALERGVIVGLRDGQEELASRMATELHRLRSDVPQLTRATPQPASSSVLRVPGGIKGLALAAHLSSEISAELFVSAYVQTLARLVHDKASSTGPIYLKELRCYFQTLAALKNLAGAQGNEAEILLDAATKPGFEKAAKALELLGWRLKGRPGAVALELGQRQSEAERQPFVSLLGVDEVEMKTSLEAGHPFLLKISDDQAPMVLDEDFWFGKILKRARPPAGLLEAFLDDLPAARLYACLADMNPETRQQLLLLASTQDLKQHSMLLMHYGGSVSFENGQVLLPGGATTAAAWERLVGASSAKPSEFLSALLSRDQGKLLAYYHTLSSLPAANQRFFAKTPQRLEAFYEVFPFADPEKAQRYLNFRQRAYFSELARELPLGPDGQVRFPGGADVWHAVKSGAKEIKQKSKLRRGFGDVVVAEPEDEILLRLLDTHYYVEATESSQVENFLAVVRLENHRVKPMDATTARLLFESYRRYKEVFPYLSSFPTLEAYQLSNFLQAAGHLERLRGEKLEVALGEFHALIQLVILLRENEAITDARATEIFDHICKRFAGAQEDAGYAAASFETLRDLLSSLRDGPAAHADDALMEAFAGTSSQVEFDLVGQRWTVDLATWRRRQIAEVLRLQTITPLQVLMTLYERATFLSQGGKDPINAFREVEGALRGLLEISREEQRKLPAEVRHSLIQTHSERIAEIVTQLTAQFNKEGKSESISQLTPKLIGELNPYLKTTLVGWIYAYYFSPLDLVVAEDPFLVRRHRFSGQKPFKNAWAGTEAHTGNSASGSFLSGGLAQIAAAASRMGLLQTAVNQSGDSNLRTEGLAATELAAVRSVPWRALQPGCMHLAGLKLRFGREVVAEAALNPRFRNELSEASRGVLAPQRHFQFLQAVSTQDVKRALKLLSSLDLYFIADWFWCRHGAAGLSSHSLAGAIAREVKVTNPRQADYFGGFHGQTYGCVHSHLLQLGPYENFSHLGLLDPMSERLSHFMLDLAESADRAGLPLAAMAILAQPAVLRFAATSKMVNAADWRTAVEEMKSVQLESLVPLLAN